MTLGVNFQPLHAHMSNYIIVYQIYLIEQPSQGGLLMPTTDEPFICTCLWTLLCARQDFKLKNTGLRTVSNPEAPQNFILFIFDKSQEEVYQLKESLCLSKSQFNTDQRQEATISSLHPHSDGSILTVFSFFTSLTHSTTFPPPFTVS